MGDRMLRINELAPDELPREKFISKGAKSLSDIELLSILLGKGTKDKSVIDLSAEILNTFPIETFQEITIKELTKFKGLKQAKALIILSSLEFAMRVRKAKLNITQFRNAKEIYDYYKDEIGGMKVEHLICLYLDVKCHLIERRLISIGSIRQSIASPQEIFKWAIKLNASGFVLIHNHPSGDFNPSSADVDFTKKMKKLGEMMEISLIDHIIISQLGYYSFSNIL